MANNKVDVTRSSELNEATGMSTFLRGTEDGIMTTTHDRGPD